MVKVYIKIAVPFDNICDSCDFIKYESEGVSAVCSIFFTQLETNSEDQHIPCDKCLNLKG